MEISIRLIERSGMSKLVWPSAGLTRKLLEPNVRGWQVQRSSIRC